MKFNTLRDLLIHELQDIRSFEQQLTEGLPAMAKAAHDEQLKGALTEHLKETKSQKERVEAILGELDVSAGGIKCQGMAGVLKEASEVMGSEGAPIVKDLGLISAAQRVEHYEMAAYASTLRLAETLGLGKVAGVLAEIHDEESAASETLASIAEQISAASDEPRASKRPSR